VLAPTCRWPVAPVATTTVVNASGPVVCAAAGAAATPAVNAIAGALVALLRNRQH